MSGDTKTTPEAAIWRAAMERAAASLEGLTPQEIRLAAGEMTLTPPWLHFAGNYGDNYYDSEHGCVMYPVFRRGAAVVDGSFTPGELRQLADWLEAMEASDA